MKETLSLTVLTACFQVNARVLRNAVTWVYFVCARLSRHNSFFLRRLASGSHLLFNRQTKANRMRWYRNRHFVFQLCWIQGHDSITHTQTQTHTQTNTHRHKKMQHWRKEKRKKLFCECKKSVCFIIGQVFIEYQLWLVVRWVTI